MSRIEFDGKGTPIPALALPPFGGESDLPSTVLTFNENADFPVAEYITLGFTHFEAWCVGAAGGRGGDATDHYTFLSKRETRTVPQDVWNLARELAVFDDYWEQNSDYHSWYYNYPYFFTPSQWPPGYVAAPAWPPGVYPPPVVNRLYTGRDTAWYGEWPYILPYDGTTFRASDIIRFNIDRLNALGITIPPSMDFTYLQIFDMLHPVHSMQFITWNGAILIPEIKSMGGGGGGGGFHKVVGALDDLPESIPVVVGKEGTDAGYAQVQQLGSWTPEPQYSSYYGGGVHGIHAARAAEIHNFLRPYLNSYPNPTTFSGNPQKGQDGGVSSFGDVAQASGGQGGEPGMVWDGSKFINKGHGGAGGIGGRLEAGGGAAGSIAEGVNGADGIWLPETGIGQGGGGGKGGLPTESGGGYYGQPSGIKQHPATAGGQGSYSFGDTTVYGQRQFRQPWTYIKPVVSYPSENITYVPTVDTNYLVTAGGGGGARPFPTVKVGSRAVGYSPNGIVIVRLTKITS